MTDTFVLDITYSKFEICASIAKLAVWPRCLAWVLGRAFKRETQSRGPVRERVNQKTYHVLPIQACI